MKIKYLQKFEENKDKFKYVKTYPTQGCSLNEIKVLEEKLNNGNPFPKVFREFLFIGGEVSCLPFNMKFSWMERETKDCLEGLKNRGLKTDRPIVVFDQLDSEQYSFIYLDEGDNPQPWNCFAVEDEETIWKSPFNTFKDLIEVSVDLALEGRGF